MSWVAWVMVTYYAFGAISIVNAIGKPREPVTPGLATGVLILVGLLAAGVISLAT